MKILSMIVHYKIYYTVRFYVYITDVLLERL